MPIILVLICFLIVQAAAAVELSPELAEKKRWIEEVESGDYLFWRRVIDRAERPSEWNPPQSLYVPHVIVDGGEMPYFPAKNPEESTINPAALEKAWSYARERNTRALLVLHKGNSIFEQYAPGFHRGSLLNARSMTKTLMGMLVGVAIEEGFINSVDDKVGQYVGEWINDARGSITLKQLLHNVSGLEFPLSPAPDAKGALLTNGTRVDEVALSFAREYAPARQFIQNNANTQVLGIILQRATGQTFADYLSAKIWRPLGASRAIMKQDRIDGSVVTYCCLQGSATDWVRIGDALMRGGRSYDGSAVLSSQWIKAMLVGSAANPNYGLHIWMGEPYAPKRSYAPAIPQAAFNTQSEPFRAKDLFYMDGGAKTRVWIVPSLELVIARLGDEPTKELGFDEAYIPNAIMDGIAQK